MRHAIAPVLLLAALTTACGHAPLATSSAKIVSGNTAQSVTRGGFQDLDGNAASLSSFAGHPVLLAFLDPNDADSQAEAPLLIRLADAYSAEGLAVVVAGEHANAAVMRAFRDTSGLSFPVWLDPSGGQLIGHRLHTVPAFAFISRSGMDVTTHDGFASRGELTAGIEEAINRR